MSILSKVEEVLTLVRGKHLPGQHDQKSHGNWADNYSHYRDIRQGMTELEWNEFVRSEREAKRGQESMFTDEEWEEIIVGSDELPPVKVLRQLEFPGVIFDIGSGDAQEITGTLMSKGIGIEDLVDTLTFSDKKGLVCFASVEGELSQGELHVDADIRKGNEWNAEKVGSIEFTIKPYEIHLDYMKIDMAEMSQGSATDVIKDLSDLGRKIGVDSITLHADISIGRYAWARLGFDYDYNQSGVDANMASDDFVGWFESKRYVHGLDEPPNGWPMFDTAQDVAAYDPGIEFTGDDIVNSDVPSNMKLHAGKAFMLDLDRVGHGEWMGNLELD